MTPADPPGAPGAIAQVPYSISLISFAFNEEESITEFLERAETLLRSLSNDVELLVANDGSGDRTGQLLDDFARTRPWVRVLHNERNVGSQESFRRLIRLVSKEVFFCQTVDWSYDLTNLARAMGELRRYDILHGVREPLWSRRGFAERSDTPRKAAISAINYLLIRVLFGLPLQDYQNITVYRRALAQSLPLESTSAFVNPEMLLRAWWSGARILEVPTPFHPRRRGVGTGTRPRFIAAAMRDIFSGWWRWRVLGKRPHKGKGTIDRWDSGRLAD